jgi:integrase
LATKRAPRQPRINLTDRKIETLKLRDERFEIADAARSHLYLVVQPSGHKSWVVRYRSPVDRRHRKLTLDGAPSVAAARELATEALDKVAKGHDPAAAKKAGRATSNSVDDAFRLFLDRHNRTKKGRLIRESTKRETARLLGYRRDPKDAKAWIATGNGAVAEWKNRTLPSMTPADVRGLLDGLVEKGPVMANRTLTALKTCFTWHVRRAPDTMAKSPCDGVDAPSPEGSGRDRTLTDAELAALWRAADATSYPFGRMVQMLILTGCRRDEVREAPWSEIDLTAREWLIPGQRTKNGREHLVPLSTAALTLLASLPRIQGKGLLFTTTGKTPISGLAKCKQRLHVAMTKDLGEEPERWTLHDLRRTFVTGLQRLRFPVEIAEACVNHRSGTMGGVTAVYARHDYRDEKRDALDGWAAHVTGIVAGRPKGVQ